MDNRIAIGNKIELQKIDTRLSVDPDKEPEIYVSQVLDESESGDLLIAMPIREGTVIPPVVGQEFKATFYTKHGLLRCKVGVVGRYKKETIFLMGIEQKSVLQKIQRRQYFRFEHRMPMEYRVLSEEEKKSIEMTGIYSTKGIENDWKKGVVLDLSGGGIRFISPQKEENGSYIQVRFEIDLDGIQEMIYVFAELLRSDQNPNKSTIYDNRIMFWKIDQELREKIIQFVFHLQRKSRSKEMGMN